MSGEGEVNYYDLLGVSRTATEKQIGSAYKTLMLRYHPDRNVGDEDAAMKYRLVGEAYNCLMDPNKRKLYDLGGVKAVSEGDVVEPKGIGGVSRVFGAVISRFGVPTSSQISGDFVETAQIICRSGGLDGDVINPSLEGKLFDLPWGIPVEGKIERQHGIYYRIVVTERHVQTGFAISIKSLNKDKFKAILFDNDGSIAYQEDCLQTRDHRSTAVKFYFTKFQTHQYIPYDCMPQSSSSSSSSIISSTDAKKDAAISMVLSKLDGLQPSRKDIVGGRYLLGIYGDNFIGKTSYSCLLVAAHNDAPAVKSIIATDEALLQQRGEINSIRAEYLKAKAAYEAAVNKIHSFDESIEGLLDERDSAYKLFLKQSVEANTYGAATVAAPLTVEMDEEGHHRKASITDNLEKTLKPAALAATAKGSIDSLGSAVSAASTVGGKVMSATAMATAATASSVGATVGSSATAAGGWLAKRISSGMTTFKTAVVPGAAGSATESTGVNGENGQGAEASTNSLTADGSGAETIV